VPEELQLDPEELHIALRHLQNFDPTGVGRGYCGECLELQLLVLPESTPSRAPRPCRRTRHSSFSRPRLREASRRRCNAGTNEPGGPAADPEPHPAPRRGVAPLEARYIVPTSSSRRSRTSGWRASTPDAVPKLRNQPHVAEILQNQPQPVRRPALASAAGSALADQETCSSGSKRFLRVSQAIVDRQRHFSSTARSRCGRWCCARSPTRSACTNRPYRASPRRNSCLRRAASRAQVLPSEVTSPPRRAAPARHRHPGAHQAAGSPPRTPGDPCPTAKDLRNPEQQGIGGRAPHHRQVPRVAANLARQREKVSLSMRDVSLILNRVL